MLASVFYVCRQGQNAHKSLMTLLCLPLTITEILCGKSDAGLPFVKAK